MTVVSPPPEVEPVRLVRKTRIESGSWREFLCAENSDEEKRNKRHVRREASAREDSRVYISGDISNRSFLHFPRRSDKKSSCQVVNSDSRDLCSIGIIVAL